MLQLPIKIEEKKQDKLYFSLFGETPESVESYIRKGKYRPATPTAAPV